MRLKNGSWKRSRCGTFALSPHSVQPTIKRAKSTVTRAKMRRCALQRTKELSILVSQPWNKFDLYTYSLDNRLRACLLKVLNPPVPFDTPSCGPETYTPTKFLPKCLEFPRNYWQDPVRCWEESFDLTVSTAIGEPIRLALWMAVCMVICCAISMGVIVLVGLGRF